MQWTEWVDFDHYNLASWEGVKTHANNRLHVFLFALIIIVQIQIIILKEVMYLLLSILASIGWRRLEIIFHCQIFVSHECMNSFLEIIMSYQNLIMHWKKFLVWFHFLTFLVHKYRYIEIKVRQSSLKSICILFIFWWLLGFYDT